MRLRFEEKLNNLDDLLIEMGKLVTGSIENAIRALEEKDVELAKEVYEADAEINKMEAEIESLALTILLTEKPVASDFRFVTTTMKMINDLERIGDQAADISYLILKLNNRSYEPSDLGSIKGMAAITIKMLEDTLTAYLSGDLDLTEQVLTRDDQVDEYFYKVREEVINDIKEERFATKNSLDIFLIAKYLERIGDHAENIAEEVYYSITAKNYKK
ncbi:phosphate signaling complex protein PhoU [uncultured Helcococcus sp.]|uniref:phosphate signaling complex protein PhoU n=1 Tax=uncultured Helcococcus sp. TaxID=1072508 RepID=UPI0026154D16|nr:phosphate signaling complex protein PhoU [uncultured Helcococcus sp.]